MGIKTLKINSKRFLLPSPMADSLFAWENAFSDSFDTQSAAAKYSLCCEFPKRVSFYWIAINISVRYFLLTRLSYRPRNNNFSFDFTSPKTFGCFMASSSFDFLLLGGNFSPIKATFQACRNYFNVRMRKMPGTIPFT